MIRLAGVVVLVTGLAMSAGCKASAKASAKTTASTDSNQALMPKVDPSLCDTSGKRVQTFDLNQDGKPDLWKLYEDVEEGGTKSEVLTCKQVDWDKDGQKDYVAVYNRRGELVAEELDLGHDGKFDAREHYDRKAGKVAVIERDTDHNKKPDLWEKYNTAGQLESIQRDRNADGKPDVWEQYSGDQLVTILYDEDFDSRVDRREDAQAPQSITPAPELERDEAPVDEKKEEPAPGAKPDDKKPADTKAPAKAPAKKGK